MTKGEYETLLILLNPVAPHITEELWQIIGGTGYVYQQKWPEFDEAKQSKTQLRSQYRLTENERNIGNRQK